jgi:hypothetical protein
MSHKAIDIQTKRVSQLLDCIDGGMFAIPKLQREFVWDGKKAAKLLDSIVSGMPIGVVMIWETFKSQRLYLRQRYHILPPFSDKNSKVWFLIDGQQRISVMHHTQKGDVVQNARHRDIDFSRVVLSLEDEEDGQQIRYRKPHEGQYVSLCDVLHPHWSKKLSWLGKRQRARVRKCRLAILRYPFYLMFVHAKLEQVHECFLRINTQGMRVTTADGIISRSGELDLRDISHEVRDNLDDSFSDMPEMPILFALAAVRGATEARGPAIEKIIRRLQRESQNDDRERKRLAREWNLLCKCFGKAVDHLRQNFRVLNRGFLYSDYMVSILALFFFWNGVGPDKRQADQIRRWFWATAAGGRYSGKEFYRSLPKDLGFFRKLADKPGTRFKFRTQVDKVDLRKTQYAGHTGLSCAVYCMLLRRGPVSILDNGLNEIPLERYSSAANRKDRHHIFPRQPLANEEVPANQYNSIANICLLTAEENQQISNRRPSGYLGEVLETTKQFGRKMNRHLIPYHDQRGIWNKNLRRGFRRFIEERAEMIWHALEQEAGVRLFRRDL